MCSHRRKDSLLIADPCYRKTVQGIFVPDKLYMHVWSFDSPAANSFDLADLQFDASWFLHAQ